MNRLRPLALAALAPALACRQERPADSPSTDSTPTAGQSAWTVTPTAFGSIRFGWDLAELNAATRDSVQPAYQMSADCDHVRAGIMPAGTLLMVVQDTVVRVDVDTTGILTAEGAGVGDTEASVLERYEGRVRVEPHPYTGPEGHYLIVTPPDETLGRIIFETDGRRVDRYRAGRLPPVEWIEGCA